MIRKMFYIDYFLRHPFIISFIVVIALASIITILILAKKEIDKNVK